MKTLSALLLAAALFAPPAFAPPAFADTEADRWNLADFYPTQADWNADASRLEAQLKSFAACAGQMDKSAASLRKCLDLQADIDRRYGRLSVYASERYAADTGDAAATELVQRSDVLGAKIAQAGAFMGPAVLRLGRARVDAWVRSEPALATYRRPLDEMLRAAPHVLGASGETLLSEFTLMNGAGGAIHSILTNADMPWPTIRLASGEEVKLDDAAYGKLRQSQDRGERQRAMEAHANTLKTFERTFGTTLYAQLKEDAVYAKVRKYPDALARALDNPRVPPAVIDTLIAQTRANLPTLHRYFRLQARLLGVAPLRYHDTYAPPVRGDYSFPLPRAKSLLLAAVAPLGADYVATLAKGLDSRWMDTYPRPNKQAGAHMNGAYGVHPLVLMNYVDDYDSLTTLAHEWGHAMHSVLAGRAQPSVTAGYATFIAEIASTFNEELLLDHLLRGAHSDDEKLFYLGTALEGLRGTYFTQAMFTEFERKIHELADAGEPISGEAFTRHYCDILQRYDGVAEGVMEIDPVHCINWSVVPHFYYGFYVYQYATSVAASSLLAQRVLAGEPGALQRYLALLAAGGSDHPYELVKRAGVDLATPAPYQAIVARMNRLMDEIEAVLARRGDGAR